MNNLDRVRSKLSPARRRKIKARADKILAEEMALREIRKALGRTQVKLGQMLGIGQEGVSRIEQRSDLLISTLRNYIEAMGGQLKIVAEFSNHRRVEISGISEIDDYRGRSKKCSGATVAA
jgi:hypothetical protein